MRIALATSSYAPHVGGVEEHVRNVARTLRERGHDVVIWTIDREGGHGVRSVDGMAVWDLPAPLPARSSRALLNFALRVPRAALHWRRAFRAHRPDVIHVQCFGPNGTYARVLAGLTRTPFVVSTHGETLADDDAVFTRSRLAMNSLRRGLAEASAVTGCSRVALDDLVARFGLEPGRGIVVFNGIELDEPASSSPVIDGRYVTAVGRLQRVKGFDLLVRAFARAGLPSDVRLVIGGGGPEHDNLRSLAEDLGVGDRLALTGWLERPQVLSLQRGALVGVVPSRFEAFGIAVLELWRAGTPLVATTRGGPPEFVREGEDGILVDPEDEEQLAEALRVLVGDAGERDPLAAAGSARVTDFTWDRVADAYEVIYERIAQPPIDAAARRRPRSTRPRARRRNVPT